MGKTRTRPFRPAYSRRVPGAYGRVLVVDDSKVIRQLIRVNLELEGFEVVTAADGVECLDLVHRICPDVITLDVVMPRLDGIQTATRLRADPRTRRLPVAVVSASTSFQADAGAAAGVDAFLEKPFEPSELVRVVHRLMSKRGAPSPDGGRGAGRAGSAAG
ncbi:response regulator [Streptomyces sp. NBC_01754]|uniref:response regulator n=1 Tax=Streptomyces sp. NBC_01754 TaxID=2975930 RepID=UPI002DD9BAA9|nr:response regulator [Streptomyces sp. NBC_01754]WSC94826.1 response regulator [Streptomyces sp. NBC_01754]